MPIFLTAANHHRSSLAGKKNERRLWWDAVNRRAPPNGEEKDSAPSLSAQRAHSAKSPSAAAAAADYLASLNNDPWRAVPNGEGQPNCENGGGKDQEPPDKDDEPRRKAESASFEGEPHGFRMTAKGLLWSDPADLDKPDVVIRLR